jgi:hypothetical protein
MGISGQRHAPVALYPRWKDPFPRYPLDKRLGGPQNWSGHTLEEKSISSAGDPTPVVQSVARHYAGIVIQARIMVEHTN